MPNTSTVELNLKKRSAARLSLLSNGMLVALKLAASVVSGSVGVLAELVNSSADVVGAAVVYLTVRVSDDPPDSDHAYGHGKIENLSGITTSGLVLAGGVFAAAKAIWQLVHGSQLVDLKYACIVMGLSASVNILVSRRLLQVGRETDSPAISADGRHLQTDVLTSLGVLAGLLLVHITGHKYWDAIVALGVSGMILRMGVDLARGTVRSLTDEALPEGEEAKIIAVLRSHPGVLGFHKLRTRSSGSHRHADVHVQIDDQITFVDAHRLTEELEDRLREALPNLHPIIHMEPYEEENAHQRAERGGM